MRRPSSSSKHRHGKAAQGGKRQKRRPTKAHATTPAPQPTTPSDSPPVPPSPTDPPTHPDAPLGRPKPQKLASQALLRMLSEKKALRQRRLALVSWVTIFLGVLTSLAIFIIAINSKTILNMLPAPSKEGGWVTSIPRAFSMPLPPNMVVLAMGVDVNPDAETTEDAFKNVRTDTMMLGRLRVSNEDDAVSASAISIPRDSKVFLSENGWVGKINGAFAYGGPERAVSVVERTTGVPVDYYVVVNLQGIAALVDAIGGVDVYVDAPMRYHDYSGNLHIDFDPGTHHLGGQQTLAYIRFRHDSLGDIGRIRRQQVFMNALSKKLKDPWTLARLPGILDTLQQHIQTNMPWDVLLRAAWAAKHISPKDLEVATLPGQSVMEDASYWAINPGMAKKMINRMILDPIPTTDEATTAQGSQNASTTPLPIGILSTQGWEDRLPEWEDRLERGGFSIVCRRTVKQARSRVVIHQPSPQLRERLNTFSDNKVQRMQRVIAPVGSTYESNYCSSNGQLTLILGDDMLSAASQANSPTADPNAPSLAHTPYQSRPLI